MAKATFHTSFGRVIPFVEGYRELHRPPTTQRSRGSSKSDPVAQVGFGGFLKDLFEYALVMDFLGSLGIRGPWESALDIGGAEGFISRLMKGEGLARRTACIDLWDMSSKLSDSTFRSHFRRFRNAVIGGRFVQRYRTGLLGESPSNFGYYPGPGSKFWNVTMERTPQIDNYIAGDIYKSDGTYDFISAFLCLEHFDLEALFPKVNSMLSPSGVFCFLTSSWW